MPLREMGREQMWMLPPTLDELLPLDHPARFVAEFVDALGRDGWSELGVEIGGDPLGAPAYHPRALLSVWLYGFMTGVRSCRKLEAACRDQISYLWLTGWQHPDHNTLWRFYKEHRQAMRTTVQAHSADSGGNAAGGPSGSSGGRDERWSANAIKLNRSIRRRKRTAEAAGPSWSKAIERPGGTERGGRGHCPRRLSARRAGRQGEP